MGFSSFNFNVGLLIVKYFETVLTLGLKLAMPVIAAGLVTEFCIGVLMKAVPSIHVFVLNVQIKCWWDSSYWRGAAAWCLNSWRR